MIRVLALLGLLVASLVLAPASAQETLGDLTLYAADGKQTHAVALQSFYFALPTTPGSGDGPDRAITMTGTINAPDPLLITWLNGPDTKRHVVLHINDGASGAPGSVYDLENARLTTLTMGYSGGGGGQQTITVEAEHLKINGLAAY